MLSLPVSAAEPLYFLGVPTITDGDTVRIDKTRFRLSGIDAPESKKRSRKSDGALFDCGFLARLALAAQIGTQPVECVTTDIDRYKRYVAVCYKADLDLNAWMVSEGHAMAYTLYNREYALDEERAQKQKAGIWQGAFDPPWDWRKQRRKK